MISCAAKQKRIACPPSGKISLPPVPESVEIQSSEYAKRKKRRVKTWNQNVAIMDEYSFKLLKHHIRSLYRWVEAAEKKGAAHDAEIEKWRKAQTK